MVDLEVIGWDTETHRIKPGMSVPRLVCVSQSGASGSSVMNREAGLDWFEARLRDTTVKLVAHHAPFDLAVMVAERPALLPLVFDAVRSGRVTCTKVRQQLIDNARGELKFYEDDEGNWIGQDYSLARLAQRYLHKYRAKGEDTWRLRYHELDDIPVADWPDDARRYAIEDAEDARSLFLVQEDVAGAAIPGEASQVAAAWALYLLGCWGVRTDPDAVADLQSHIETDYADAVGRCQEHGLRRADASRDLAAIRVAIAAWFWRLGLDPVMTDGGKAGKPQISTTRDQLLTPDTDGQVDPGLAAVAESVALGKLLTTYVPVLRSGTRVPICPSYNAVRETFRTSCRNPNLQNLPRGGRRTAAERLASLVRRCFVPRPGSVFVFVDYDTIEMRTLAQVCLDLFGYSMIAEAIREGRDLHVDLASEVEQIPYAEAWDLYRGGDAWMEHVRQVCKIGNYGFAGGMGPHTFVDYARGFGVPVPLDLSRRIHSGFRRKWLETNDFFQHCQYLTGNGQAEAIVFPRSGMVRGRVPYTAVCNGFFQELAAQGAKSALVKIVEETFLDESSPIFGSRAWLFAHDEIGTEVPYAAFAPERASAAAFRMRDAMVEAMQTWCPDVPIAATPVMTRRWYKGAKSVMRDQILVPGRPERTGDGKVSWVADL